MKKKITISLDELILSKIDENVELGDGKNRSSVIENILKEKFGNFTDVSVIIFCHDEKWDNREYPFDKPKVFLEVSGKSILERQIDIFKSVGIKHISLTINSKDRNIFEKFITKYKNNLLIDLVECNKDDKTGTVIKKTMNNINLYNNLIISNGDIYYGSLNLEEYFNYHKEQKSDFSHCLKFVLNPEQLGNVKINGNKIIEFVERPKASQMNLTNSGLYITTKKFLLENNFGEYLEVDFFPKLPDICNNIGYIYSGEWEHIQNDSAYERINGWLI